MKVWDQGAEGDWKLDCPSLCLWSWPSSPLTSLWPHYFIPPPPPPPPPPPLSFFHVSQDLSHSTSNSFSRVFSAPLLYRSKAWPSHPNFRCPDKACFSESHSKLIIKRFWLAPASSRARFLQECQGGMASGALKEGERSVLREGRSA